MISRCPSCGAPAPDEARQCRACGWDFVANKKGEKKPESPKKAEPGAEKPKSAAPPSGGLGMTRLPKVEPGGFAAPGGAADENPFALPVARNLGPKPGESLFGSPPPEPEAPPQKVPALKKEEPPVKEAPKKEPPRKIDAPKPAPAREPSAPIDSPKANQTEEPVAEKNEDGPSAALFLPSSTKEIVVEPAAKRAEPEAPAREPKGAAAEPAAAKSAPMESPKPAGRRSAVYLAALAGAALGLLSVGAIFMMLRTEPQGAARPTGSSPFGKRSTGDATVTPVFDEPAPSAPHDSPKANPPPAPPVSPAPVIASEEPAPTSIPAPAVSKPIEPPAPLDSPKANPARPTATFAQTARPKPVPAPSAAKPPAAAAKKSAAAGGPKKPAGPQWVFEGTVYDLLTTRGVYGVRLVFVDAEDNEAASIETGEGGHYRASMKAGPPEGYALRIVHDDYSGKHIDELDSTSSVRKADLEQRKFLMQSGARSLPWIGSVGKPVRRDMALVPRVSEEK